MAQKRKPDYSLKQVRWALENYLVLHEGHLPAKNVLDQLYGIFPQRCKNINDITYLVASLKSDIDRAIQDLKPTERAVIIAVPITGFTLLDVAYWWDKTTTEIEDIEEYAMRKIRRILNKGQKAFNYQENTKKQRVFKP